MDQASTLNTLGLTLPLGSTLTLQLAGLTASSQYSQVNISGSATLGGTLDVLLAGGYRPSPGNQFHLFSGPMQSTFGTVTLPSLLLASSGTSRNFSVPVYCQWEGSWATWTPTALSTAWTSGSSLRSGCELGRGLPGTPTATAPFNGLDINLIASNWLQTAVSGKAGSGAAVPEPPSIVLAAIGMLGVAVAARRASPIRCVAAATWQFHWGQWYRDRAESRLDSHSKTWA